MLSLVEFFQDLGNPLLSFLPKALLVAVMSAVVCGVIGSHVVLRGMVFVGHAVAHSVFPGLAIAFVLQGSLVVGGMVAGVLTAVFVAVFSQNRRLKEDSVIGIFFVGAFALGIVVISGAPGYSGSLQNFLFGSITGIPDSNVYVVAGAGVAMLLLAFLFHKEIVAVSLDREMARSAGLPILALDILLYVMVAVSVVVSVQVIGNILVIALLVVPAATARLLTDRLGLMMVLAPAIGAVCAFVGLYLSWAVDIPTGGTIVLLATAVFVLTWVLAPRHGLLGKLLAQRSVADGEERAVREPVAA
ncbi:anchored repeat-type ABC transporter permease subunit [Georgenia satyanarayanai]|uniref:anchored repeat-type ABC transporter permease subunit n=1 Tax=Georgenia satyanarayanai TaxID=860221 RepID=UPI00126400C3|nr:anchored repeat-type ABC transporter permease subunit [Georgenia satyanarayanai]